MSRLAHLLIIAFLFTFCLNGRADKVEGAWLVIQQTVASSTPVYIERATKPAKDETIENLISERLYKMVSPQEAATSTTLSSVESLKSVTVKQADSPELAPFRTINALIGKHVCLSDEITNTASFVICNDQAESVVIDRMIPKEFATIVYPSLPITLDVGACSEFHFVGGDKRSFDCSGMYGVSFYIYTESHSAQHTISATIMD